VGKGDNWQVEPAIGEDPGQEGASAVRISIEAIHLDSDSDAINAYCTESFPVQDQGGRIR
jgi:hypothetical protein